MSEETNEAFRRFMSRHLVALVGGYTSFNTDGSHLRTGIFGISGFTIEFMGRWFWVTAGHRLKDELDGPIDKGYLKLRNVAIADYFGLNPLDYHVLPFWYEPQCGFYIDDPVLGLDFGLIPLPDLLRANMEVNGVVTFSREHWINQPDSEFSQFKMLGFPSFLKDDVEGIIRPAMIAIDRLTGEELEEYPDDVRFIGRIPDDVTIPDIEGMSGGPIYGFRQVSNGQWTYHVVALQSSWLPKKRVIFGCSVPLFAETVHEEILAAWTQFEQDKA